MISARLNISGCNGVVSPWIIMYGLTNECMNAYRKNDLAGCHYNFLLSSYCSELKVLRLLIKDLFDV